MADVDAITLSLANMSKDDLPPHAAATGVIVAASVNSLAKAGMAASIGGRPIGLPLLASSVVGILSAWLWLS
jgi:uncharacterized membrane protein (DUF4010 family)